MLPAMDFETYSESGYRFDAQRGHFVPLMKGKPGIKGINAPVYAEHPSTRLLSLAYDLLDGVGVRLWIAGDPPPAALCEYIAGGGLLEAHNSGFEFYIWHFVCHCRMGWPEIPLGQLRCSAAKAKSWGLPGGLDALTSALDSTEKKDKRGKKLIQLLSIPRKPTKADPSLCRTFEAHPVLHYEMYDYNAQDVKAEMSVSESMPEMSPFETQVWLCDQHINTRGVQIDTEGLQACLALYEKAERKYTDRLRAVTGGSVQTVGEITKNAAGDNWMQGRGVALSSLDKDHVSEALAGPLPDDVREVLTIRQMIGGASAKKLFAMHRHLSSDGRIRDLFAYAGAIRTRRWAGRGPQPQNLKNSGPGMGDREWGNALAEEALADIAAGDLEAVESKWGAAVDLIGSCLRSLFVAARRRDLLCSDYSAIEAVVLAAMAGEAWRLEVFNTHGKIYETSASKISGIPLEEILQHKIDTGKHHPLRKKIGKIAELASGYAGWIGAWKAFGADEFMTDDEIKQNILKWREESPSIAEMWGGQWRKVPGVWDFYPEFYGVEGMAVSAIHNPGHKYTCNGCGFYTDPALDVFAVTLPSGGQLTYHTPRLIRDRDPRGLDVYKITFMGVHATTKQWVRQETYGGRLTENIVQATSRDILAAAIVRVERAGYPVVLHVHDELVCEVPEGTGSIEELERLMEVREPWFADWPIRAAGGWRGHRYRK